jgi:transcriptional regulator with XRE-family HTH domain
MEQQTFGEFLKKKRLEREITLRGFAGMMEVSAVYVCDVEKNRKPAPSDGRLEAISRLLRLDKREIEIMYDLAARSRSRPAVSNDLPEYIMENDVVRVALRTAKDVDATDEEWREFIEKLNQRIKRQTGRGEEDGGT